RPPIPTLFPYTTLFRSHARDGDAGLHERLAGRRHAPERARMRALYREAPDDLVTFRNDVFDGEMGIGERAANHRKESVDASAPQDRKSTRLNSSHEWIS